jgi:hypothetical protein
MNVKLQWRQKDTPRGRVLVTGYMSVKAAMKLYKEEVEQVCTEARLIYFADYHDHVHKVLKEAPKFEFKVEVLVTKIITARDMQEAGELGLGMVKGRVKDFNPEAVTIDGVELIDEEEVAKQEAKDAGDAQDPNFN